MPRSGCCDAPARSKGQRWYCCSCGKTCPIDDDDELVLWRVSKMIEMQSSDWDPETAKMPTPELRLWMAVVRQAIFDLRFYSHPKPQSSKELFGEALQQKLSQWRKNQDLADEAAESLLGVACVPCYAVLGLNPGWVRRVVSRCISGLRGVPIRPAGAPAAPSRMPGAIDPSIVAYLADLRRRKAGLRADAVA